MPGGPYTPSDISFYSGAGRASAAVIVPPEEIALFNDLCFWNEVDGGMITVDGNGYVQQVDCVNPVGGANALFVPPSTLFAPAVHQIDDGQQSIHLGYLSDNTTVSSSRAIIKSSLLALPARDNFYVAFLGKWDLPSAVGWLFSTQDGTNRCGLAIDVNGRVRWYPTATTVLLQTSAGTIVAGTRYLIELLITPSGSSIIVNRGTPLTGAAIPASTVTNLLVQLGCITTGSADSGQFGQDIEAVYLANPIASGGVITDFRTKVKADCIRRHPGFTLP